MSQKQYNMAVVIGRFQLDHIGHSLLFRRAASVANNVLILKGSSHEPRTVKNPFTFEEIATNLYAQAPDLGTALHVRPIVDFVYSDDAWLKQVQNTIHKVYDAAFGDYDPKQICIVGHKKDESSYYLEQFPQFDSVNVEGFKLALDSTSLRTLMYTDPEQLLSVGKSLLAAPTHAFLTKFVSKDNPAYARLVQEYNFYQDYKKQWGEGPFITADGVVVKSGHVLLVKRGDFPGEGLWAIPGGFVNKNERIFTGCLRELDEETKIDVPPGLLAGSKVRTEVYDHVGRSLRGRVVTHASLFRLDGKDKKPGLPKVQGSDDAKEARWFPINEIPRMRRVMFEDHYSILVDLLGLE